MARAGSKRLSALEAWLRANRDALTAACGGLVKVHAVAAVLRVLTLRASDAGVVDETVQQLADATLLSVAQVKRALDVLTGMGVLRTIEPARSGGRGGGKGRAPVRVITFIAATEPATGDPEGVGITKNGGAVSEEWQRSNPEMAAQLTAPPHGLRSTGYPPNPPRAADAELTQRVIEGGTDAHKGRSDEQLNPSLTEACTEAVEGLLATAYNGRAGKVKNPDAWKRAVRQRSVMPALCELRARYARLDEIPARSEAWCELVTVLRCKAAGNGEAPSHQAWEALEPYRHAAAASEAG